MVRAPADPLRSRTSSRGRSQRRDTGRGPAFRFTSTHSMRACWRESMRAAQREPDRGNCSRSRAMMPYNSTATRTKCSDSMVHRCPPSALTPSELAFRKPIWFLLSICTHHKPAGADKGVYVIALEPAPAKRIKAIVFIVTCSYLRCDITMGRPLLLARTTLHQGLSGGKGRLVLATVVPLADDPLTTT